MTPAMAGPSPHPMAVTLATIARQLKVSKVTVSLALRGNPRISLQTREKVVKLAAELGYTPNPMVRALMVSLREHRRPTGFFNLAFVTAFAREDGWKRYPTVVRYFESAKRHAASLGYGMEHHWTGEAGGSGKRLTGILESRGIPGVLIAPLPRLGVALGLDWTRFSTVAIGWSFNEVPCHHVATNQFHSMNTALATCLARGYRRIGFALPAVVDEKSERVWRAAYLGFLSLHPELARLEPHAVEPFTEEAYLAWHEKNRPDVVLSSHALIHDWLIQADHGAAARTAFVYLDWTPESAAFVGMNQQPEEIGAAAVELLVEQINLNRRGVPRTPKSVQLEAVWEEGAGLPVASPKKARAQTSAERRRKNSDTVTIGE